MPIEASAALSVEQENGNLATREIIIEYGAKLAGVEIVLGSIVQALGIPLGGHALSLNQAIFLTQAVRRAESQEGTTFLPLYISTNVAVLKSLAPMGKKLGPMLAISMQGFLYSLGLLLGGQGRVGILLAFLFSSQWAFVQPLFTLYLFFGSTFLEASVLTVEKISDGLGFPFFASLLLIPLFKALLAIGIGWRVSRWTVDDEARYLAKLENYANQVWPSPRAKSAVATSFSQRCRLALADVCRPIFLFSLFLLIAFLFVQQKSVVEIFWWALRPLALAFLCSYATRSPFVRRLLDWMKQKGCFSHFFSYFEATLQQIARNRR